MATGLAMRGARDLPAAGQEAVWSVVRDWPGLDPFVFPLNVLGTLGWVVAVGGLALWARRAGAPRAQWLTLGLTAVALMGGHPAPGGTIAFGSLFLAALVHERGGVRRAVAGARLERA
jgi:hypothetical protein